MRWKLKIFMITVFILIIFLLIKIRKKSVKNKLLPWKPLQNNIELFEDVTSQQETLKFNITKFRKTHIDKYEIVSVSNITDLLGKINTSTAEVKQITFKDSYEDETSDKTKIKTYITGPSGICYRPDTDDLIVFDRYKLRTFQCRDNRTLSDSNPQFKFNLKTELTIKYGNKKGVLELKQNRSEGLNAGEDNRTLLISFLNQISDESDDVNGALNLDSSDDDIKKDYQKMVIALKSNLRKTVKLMVKGKQIDKISNETNDLFELYDFNTRGRNTYANILAVLEEIYQNYEVFYLKKENCFKKNSCLVNYQPDIPPFKLPDERRGFHELKFDGDPKTIYHPERADLLMNTALNKWEGTDMKGVFQPDINYEIYKQSKFSASELSNFTVSKIVPPEGDGFKPETGFATLNIDGNKALFKLVNEFDNIGVNLLYDNRLKCVFVPDCLNNRIQIMKPVKADFFYVGQFGNLPYASYRSLPNYRGEEENDNNPLLSGGIMYEPIIDSEEFKMVERHNCSFTEPSLQEFFQRGPFPLNGSSNPTRNCNLKHNIDRMDFHSRNILTEFKDDGSAEKGTIVKALGHFNKLRSEWKAVNLYDEVGNKFVDQTQEYNYDNPHFILSDTDRDKDGFSHRSLAYRKLLYKNIKITNEGQKFGQLFRPKAVAFDDDLKNMGGQKYYVVDTYHHCIQCFELKPRLKRTVDGAEFDFISADDKLNQNMDHYLYDNNMEFLDYIIRYNKSEMYSLGIRQRVLSSLEEGGISTLLNTHSDWALANGQYVLDGRKRLPHVHLFRWLSGSSKFANNAYGTTRVDYDDTDLGELPFFYTEISTKLEISLAPGCGEFLYPSDVLITKNPFNGEKLLFVADMGNNRVSIFKKYLIEYNKKKYYRFRFYRFLNEKNPENIINPLSITCCENTGRIYVLNGQVPSANQNIVVYRPEQETKGGKTFIKYENKLTIPSNNLGITDTLRCVRIQMDDRGFLTCVLQSQTDGGESQIKIINENYSGTTEPFTLGTPEIRLNNIFFPLDKNDDFFEKPINDDLENLNRFRIAVSRYNISIGDNKADYLVSPEFKLDYIFKRSNETTPELDQDEMYLKYKFKDGYEFKPYDTYWSKTTPSFKEPIEVDLINNLESPATRKVAKYQKNYDIDKYYKIVDMGSYKNRILYNFEDWQGANLTPNSTYQYKLSIYDYHQVKELKTTGTSTDPLELTTLPLSIKSGDILRRFEPDTYDEDRKLEQRKHINLSFSYGRTSSLHNETQKYNPLYAYIFRKEHNRTRDVTTRYLNLSKNQFIQIIIPEESKYISTEFSAPKFGKLYIFNAFRTGSILEQNQQMQYNRYYKQDNLIIYYSTQGGKFPLPTQEELDGNDFIDDFFTLGDNPETIHTQIKFRVRIKVKPFDSDNEEEIIRFHIPENINDMLTYYRKNSGNDEHSLVFLKKEPLFYAPSQDNEYFYKETINYVDKGSRMMPLSYNKTYEYYVMIGNHKVINSAINSFYITTKPSKPLFNKKGLELVKMEKNGRRETYLKIEWFTPKNESLYWPYNFIVCRRINYLEKNTSPLISETPKLGKNIYFDVKDERIRIKPNLPADKIIDYFQVSFSNPIGDRKISFSVYGSFMGIDDKDIIPKLDDFSPEDKKHYSAVTLTKRAPYEDFSLKIPVRIKYLDSKSQTTKVIPWSWEESKNFIELSEAGDIEIEIPLAQGFTLQKIKCVETVVIPEDGFSPGLTDYETRYKEIRQEEIKKLQKELEKKANEKAKLLNKERREKKNLGAIFLLQDDYEDVEKSNYHGYSGQLYHFLKDKTKEDLLKIFDKLHEKILIYHGDITMKLEGPGGMLRSGNTDILVDKIRYMSQILRTQHQDARKTMKIECDIKKVSDLFDSSKSRNNRCKTQREQQLLDKKKQLKTERDNVEEFIKKEKERLLNLERIFRQMKAQIEFKKKQAARRITAQNRAEIVKLQNELKILESQKNEEQKKIDDNQELKEKQSKLDELTDKTIPALEEEQETGGFLTDPAGKKSPNAMPANIDILIKSEKATQEPGILAKFKELLNINKVLKNRTYIRQNEIPEDALYGDALTEDLQTFFENLRTGYTTKPFIRKDYEKNMFNIIYDFNKRQILFLAPGEKVSENLEQVKEAENFIIIFMNTPEVGEDAIAKLKEKGGVIEKQSKARVANLNEEIEAKKKAIKSANPTATKAQINTIYNDDADLKRIEIFKKQLETSDKTSGLSDWSFLKHGKDELFTSVFPTDKEISNVLENYAITPTLASLKSREVKGKDLFSEEQLEEMNSIYRKEIENKDYLPHQQFIKMSDYNSNPYEYCIGTFQTGYTFNTERKKIFMGMEYLSEIKTPEKLKISSQMPILHHGGTYSEIISLDKPLVNEVPQEVYEPPAEVFASPPAPTEPIIKSFSPKEGKQGSVVEIIGLDLDKIEYFCFRDIKAEILQTRKSVIKKGEENIVYDSVLLKVPTLKELGKECWQSLRPYEVLVWGYYKATGKQIRTSEVDDLNENVEGHHIHRLLMFRYTDRTTCPDDEKLKLPSNF